MLQIDDVAIDPVDWTLMCVRTRLPEMLDYAGAGELAEAVRADMAAVERGIEKVEKKIGELSRVAA